MPAPTADVVATPDALAPIPLITPYIDTVRPAIEAHAGDGIDFYDALIRGCRRTRRLGEDLIRGLRVKPNSVSQSQIRLPDADSCSVSSTSSRKANASPIDAGSAQPIFPQADVCYEILKHLTREFYAKAAPFQISQETFQNA